MLQLNKETLHDTPSQNITHTIAGIPDKINYAIDKVDRIYGVSYHYFFTNYLKINKPCLITSLATENWTSRRNWVTSDGQPNFDFLMKEFGSSMVPVADCNIREYNSQHKINMLFKDYLEYWQKLNLSEDGSPNLYLKDWHFLREYPKYEAYKTPEYCQSDWLNEFCANKSDDYKFVYMGPKGTWTPLHADVFGSYSWSANICGRKRWWLFPPGHERFLKDESKQMFYILKEEDLSKCQVSCLEIIQEAGEIVFVPSGWYHQVWNMEDTISINHNWFNGCNIMYIWHCLNGAASDVEREISDCKNFDGWEDQWQVILKVHHGLNYADFLQMLQFIFESRCKYLSSLDTFDYSEQWEQMFDIVSIKSVCKEMLCCKLPKYILEYVKSLEIAVLNFLSKHGNE